GDVRQDLATQVSRVFSQGKLSVQVNVVHGDVAGILIAYARGAGIELGAVFLRPPVPQVAVGIVLTALIIKTVRQFMANSSAGIAIVGCVIHLGIVERRLQYAGWEIDVVHLGAVVGVDRGGRDVP